MLWPILLLLGIERVRIVPGLMPASPLDFVYYPFSHSLLMAIVWGVLIGGAYYIARRRKRDAWIVGALVVSHWFLDVPMHAPDLPLWPGSNVRVGASLRNHVGLSLAIELVMFAIGIAIYVRATRAMDAIGRWALWAMIVLLAASFLGTAQSAPPSSVRVLALEALGLWLFVPWELVDRHRVSSAAHANVVVN